MSKPTGLPRLSSGRLSHNGITCFSSGKEFAGKILRKYARPLARQYGNKLLSLLFESINFTTDTFYHGQPNDRELLCIPVDFEIIEKTVAFSDVLTVKEKGKGTVIENQSGLDSKNFRRSSYRISNT